MTDESGDLYFYIINTTGLKNKNSWTKYNQQKHWYQLEESGNVWIFAPKSFNDNQPGDTKGAIDLIGNFLQPFKKANKKFSNMYFGIHGADWGIQSDHCKSDSFVLEDFGQSYQYNETVEQTRNFVEKMKQEYGANDCVVQVFSHTGESKIYNCFMQNFEEFLTREKQLELFGAKKTRQEGKDARRQISETSFDYPWHQSEPKIDFLETLFFEFRLCLATLAALDSAKDKDLREETLNRIRFLLKGGTLKRTWVENIIVETERKKEGTSLRENHYIEENKVLGIGHFVKLYDGDTLQIKACLGLQWKDQPKDVLMKNFKEIVPIIEGILEAKRKSSGKSK